MTTAIQTTGLSKRYGELQALKSVDLQIERGEFFGLLGPNGAGKSTLISILAGLVRASDGNAAVCGHDVVKDYRQARAALGLVPQELVYDPFFPIEDLLRIQAGYFGFGKEQQAWLDHLLQRLDLTDKRKNTMRELSGGMKRRVLIAKALVHKPPVIILDEPTAGVDVELRRTLWSFARELHADGHTVVLTTHYLEEAEQLCDRVAILDKGQIKIVQETAGLLARHPFQFLRVTLEGEASVPAPLIALREAQNGSEWEFRLQRGEHNIPDVLDSLRSAGFRIGNVQTRDPSLEDIFVELTGKSP